ncbi:MAG: type II toxin-antitoxin system VapC family toxin [Bacteroidales bacterium]|nr:type II toxin-antitoxin system VapC family toxin [Bacteroidales bacterium]MCF8390562.1 type II toxin-antitoxin system VapC family toxin [Bacteroidales bacterium]
MSGNKLFLDTNIILYLLEGDETVSELLNNKQFYISFITQLELLSFPGLTKKDISIIERLLSECVIIDINSEIKATTTNLRRKFKIKLPDCIIAATSLYLDLPLITADDDFKKIDHLNLLFYKK